MSKLRPDQIPLDPTTLENNAGTLRQVPGTDGGAGLVSSEPSISLFEDFITGVLYQVSPSNVLYSGTISFLASTTSTDVAQVYDQAAFGILRVHNGGVSGQGTTVFMGATQGGQGYIPFGPLSQVPGIVVDIETRIKIPSVSVSTDSKLFFGLINTGDFNDDPFVSDTGVSHYGFAFSNGSNWFCRGNDMSSPQDFNIDTVRSTQDLAWRKLRLVLSRVSDTVEFFVDGDLITTQSIAGKTLEEFAVGVKMWALSNVGGLYAYVDYFKINITNTLNRDLPVLSGIITSSLDSSIVQGALAAIASLSRTSTSDGSGVYSFPGILDGNYTLDVTKSGFAPYSAPVTVAGNTQENVIITPYTYTVSGNITSADTGLAINNVNVTVGTRPVVTSDISGNYSRDTVPDGTHTVLATKSNNYFNNYSGSVVVSGANATKNFTMVAIPNRINVSNTYSLNGQAGITYGYKITVTRTVIADQIGYFDMYGPTYPIKLTMYNSAQTQLVNITGNMTSAGWTYFTLPSPLTLSPGEYMLAVYSSVAAQLSFGYPSISHDFVTGPVGGDGYFQGGDNYPAQLLSPGFLPGGIDLKVRA